MWGGKSLKGHITTPILGFKGALVHSLPKSGGHGPSVLRFLRPSLEDGFKS